MTPSYHPLDPSGDGAAALRETVKQYGDVALSRPKVLENAFADLIPPASDGTGRLLLRAAEFDVVSRFRGYLGDGVDVDTAVRLTSDAMCSDTRVASDACLWATSQFVETLGYSPSAPLGPAAAAPPPPPGAGQFPAPPFPPGSQTYAPQGAPGAPPPWGAPPGADNTVPPPGGPLPPPGAPMPPPPPGAPMPGGPAPYPGQPVPGPQPWPAPQPSGGSRNRTPLIVGGVVVAIALIVGIAAAAGAFSSSKKRPVIVANPTTTSTATTVPPNTTPPSSSGSTGSSGNSGTVPVGSSLALTTLMPDQNGTDSAGNIDVAECQPITPTPAGLTGLTNSLGCADVPGYTGWELFGYKFNSKAAYSTSIVAYLSDKGFTPSAATSGCPPKSGGNNAQGTSTWNNHFFPATSGQILDCLYVFQKNSSARYGDYVWTLPTQNAFFEMVASSSASFKALENWWAQDGGPGH